MYSVKLCTRCNTATTRLTIENLVGTTALNVNSQSISTRGDRFLESGICLLAISFRISSSSLNLENRVHNFDRRQTFVIISVEKVKWWIISTVYTYLPCQTLILFFKRILRCDFSLRRNTVLKFRLSIDREKTKMQKYRKYVGKYLWKNSTSATLVATTEKKKKRM